MEATDIIEICEYILKQRELAVEKDESEDWVFEYLRHIDEKLSKLEYCLKKKNNENVKTNAVGKLCV